MASAAKPAYGEDRSAVCALSDADLAWLACPVCRSTLKVVEAQLDKLPAIRCTGCERRYPIVDGLPILLANRATPYSATRV